MSKTGPLVEYLLQLHKLFEAKSWNEIKEEHYAGGPEDEWYHVI